MFGKEFDDKGKFKNEEDPIVLGKKSEDKERLLKIGKIGYLDIDPEKLLQGLINPEGAMKEYIKKEYGTVAWATADISERAILFEGVYRSQLCLLSLSDAEQLRVIESRLEKQIHSSGKEKCPSEYHNAAVSIKQALERAGYGESILDYFSFNINKKPARDITDTLAMREDEISNSHVIDLVRSAMNDWEQYERSDMYKEPAKITREDTTAKRIYESLRASMSTQTIRDLPGIFDVLVTDKDILRVYNTVPDRQDMTQLKLDKNLFS